MHLFQHTGERRFSLQALMNFVDFICVNSTAAAIEDVNAANEDLPANSVTDGIALDGTELLALAATNGVAILQTAATAAEQAAIARELLNHAGLAAVVTAEPGAFDDLDASGSPLLRRSPRSVHGLG